MSVVNVSESLPALFSPTLKHFFSEEGYRIYDTILAVTLFLCTVVGLPGNLLSLIFFCSANRRGSSFIYTMVATIDICTCVFHLPSMIALYSGRKPGIFGNKTFCVTWMVAFTYVQLMSMFLVMLLSVSRTITLIFLRYQVKKKFLVAAFLAYTCFLNLWHIIAHVFGGPNQWYGYHEFDVQCYRYLSTKPVSYIEQLMRAICISIPPILTSISFVLVTYKLSRKGLVSNTNKRKHQAVVTIAMFTALFLVCNLPCLLNNTTYFVSKLLHDWPGPIYSQPFMTYYSWVISDVLCTVLNAALNPILYMYRMSELKEWVSSQGSQRAQSRRTPQRGAQMRTMLVNQGN